MPSLLPRLAPWGALCAVLLWVGGAPAAPGAAPAGMPGATHSAASDAASDAALERRVTGLSEQLRCLVCQNQSIADSQAQLALDLKNRVREQLAAGRSEREALDFLVQRYGDFVLYRPPLKYSTWLLWFGPFLLLVLGLGLLLRTLRHPRRAPADLSDAELARGAALLAGENHLKETR